MLDLYGKWGADSVSWEHFSPKIHLPISAFVPSALPRDMEWGPATHRTMGQFCHLETENACEKGKCKEIIEADLTWVRQQSTFSGGHLSHSPEREVRRGFMPPPNASMGCLHCPTTHQAPNASDQKGSAFLGAMESCHSETAQQVIYIYRSSKLEVFGDNCITFFFFQSVLPYRFFPQNNLKPLHQIQRWHNFFLLLYRITLEAVHMDQCNVQLSFRFKYSASSCSQVLLNPAKSTFFLVCFPSEDCVSVPFFDGEKQSIYCSSHTFLLPSVVNPSLKARISQKTKVIFSC